MCYQVCHNGACVIKYKHEVCFEKDIFICELTTRFAGQGGIACAADSGSDSVGWTGVGE